MSQPAAQVRVRLSADGVRDVVDALRQVEKQAKTTASAGGTLATAFKSIKSLLPGLGLAAVAGSLVSMAKSAFEAADAMSLAAEKAGVSVESLSKLSYAASQSDVEFSTLTTGIKKWQVSLSNAANEGAGPAAKALQELGLSAAQLKSLRLEDQLAAVAERFATIKNPADRARIAVDLFGKAGTDLIPLLSQGAAGIKRLTDEADNLGITLSTQTARGVDELDKAIKRLKATQQGFIQRQVGGFALALVGTGDKDLDQAREKIVAYSQEINRLTAGGTAQPRAGSPDATRLDELKLALAEVIKQRQIYLDKTSAAAAASAVDAESVQDSAAAAKVRLDIEQAILQATGKEREARLSALDEEVARRREALALAGGVTAKDEESLKLWRSAAAAQIDNEIRAKADAERERAAREQEQRQEKASREAEKSERERLKAIEEQTRKEEAAGEARFDIEQKLLEASGRTRDARLAALDQEIAKYREVLAAAQGGTVTPQDEAALGQYRDASVATIDLEDAQQRAQAMFDELARQRERITQDVELGIKTQYEGEQAVLEIELQRLPVLQAIAAQALAAAQATGSPEAIAQAQALSDAVRQVDVSVQQASDGLIKLKKGAEGALNQSLTNGLSTLQEFESVGDIFRSLALSVVSALQQIAAQMLATYITSTLLKGVFGGAAQGGQVSAVAGKEEGGIAGYATGGKIDARAGGLLQGPGTSTSDSIPAITTSGKPLLLSDQEFIVRASVVRQPGMLEMLKRINNGAEALSMSPRRMPRRYAEGGALGDQTQGVPKHAGFAGVLGLEDGLVMRQLETEAFDRLLIRKLERNRSSLKTIVTG